MPLQLAARVHAFVHGLFRPTDEAETRALYKTVSRLFESHGLCEDGGRERLTLWFAEQVAAEFEIDPHHHRFPAVVQFVSRLFDYEQFFVLPDLDWTER